MQNPIPDYLREVLDALRDDTSGECAGYIPELAEANPDYFALAVTTAMGSTYTAGDAGIEFTIQSISKPFAYAAAIMDRGLEQVLERERVALDEFGEQIGGVGALRIGGLVELADALRIAERGIVAEQPVAEQPLHLAGALESETLGEANDRRRLNTAAIGDDGQCFERDIVGFVENVTRDLLEPLAQRFVSAHDLGAQFFRRNGGGRDVGQLHSPPSSIKTEYLFKTCNATVALCQFPRYRMNVSPIKDME